MNVIFETTNVLLIVERPLACLQLTGISTHFPAIERGDDRGALPRVNALWVHPILRVPLWYVKGQPKGQHPPFYLETSPLSAESF